MSFFKVPPTDEEIAESAKWNAEQAAYAVAFGPGAAAINANIYGPRVVKAKALGIADEWDAINLLALRRLLSVEETAAVVARFVLMAEEAKSNLRKALA